MGALAITRHYPDIRPMNNLLYWPAIHFTLYLAEPASL